MAYQIRGFIVFIILVSVCSKQIKGSCLSYGHSCWGAHGKRAGQPGHIASSDVPGAVQFQPQQQLDQSHPLPAALNGAERWALIRVLPEKNAYYPFNKMIYPSPAMESSTYVYSDGLGSFESDSLRIGSESPSSAEGKLADNSNDLRSLVSTEQNVPPEDEQLLTAVAVPNILRKDHRHNKKTQSIAANHRYTSSDNGFEDNANIARFLPNYNDVSQILLTNAAVASAARLSDNDAFIKNTQFNRKLLTDNNKSSTLLNA
ncbi:uncharacterized protein LOC121588367 [Anopheles merus]|uniref:uncharacterized protein LOC121588367 n=1 Tax=Anopheles merus TaxID=30066 RepID=UPI001BE4A6E7|nr:uncharacterized protein LOC121588367 [Anopheles merus]